MSLQLDRIFYRIDAETNDFKEGMEQAEKSIKNFTEYLRTKPTLALAGVSVALLGVALQAAKMAAEIDKSFRIIQGLVPDATVKLNAMRKEVEALSRAGPHSQAELAKAVALIAQKGIESTDAALIRLRAALEASEATGTDLNVVIEGLDQTLDLFDKKSEDAAESLATLFGAAKGKVSLDELFAALELAGPAVRTFGLDMDTTARALVGMVDAGFKIRKAGSELAALADDGAEGAKAIKSYAAGVTDVSVALDEMTAAADRNKKSLEATQATAANQFKAAMIDLGNIVLPHLTNSINLLTGATGRMRSTFIDLERDAKIQTIGIIAGQIDRLTGTERLAAIEKLRNMVREVATLEGIDRSGLNGFSDALEILDKNALKTQGNFFMLTEKAKLLENALKKIGPLSFEPTVVTAERPKGGPPPKTHAQITAEAEAARTLRENLQKADEAAQSMGQSIRAGLGTATVSGVDDAEAALQNFTEQVEDLRKKFQTAGKAIPAETMELIAKNTERLQKNVVLAGDAFAKLNRETEELKQRRIDQIFADATVTQVDNLQLALADLVKELRELKVPEEIISSISGMNAEFIQATKVIESTNDVLQQLNETQGGLQRKDIGFLGTRVQELTALKETLTNEQARLVVQQKINDLMAEMRRLAEGVFDLPELPTVEKNIKETAQDIERAARAGIQLAQAFGLVDENAARALASIAQIGAGIVSSDPLQVLGGFASLIGPLFDRGPDPVEIKANELRLRNIEALKELRDTIGNLSADLSGRQISGVRAATGIGNAGDDGIRSLTDLSQAGVEAALKRLGLSMSDLRKVAEELGIELDDSSPGRWMRSIVALNQAIQASEFTRFAETFAGRLDLLNAKFEVFNTTDPVDQLLGFIDVLTGEFGSTLFAGLQGLSFDTPEGRAAAQSIIEGLFSQLQAGTLDASALGGLSPQQLLDAILRIRQLLNDATPAVEDFNDAVKSTAQVLNESLSGLNLNFRIFNVGLDEQASQFLDALSGIVPGLQEAIGEMDLTTEEGREAVRNAFRQFFAGLTDASDLGGLSLDELGRFILDFFGILDGFEDAIPDPAKIEGTAEALSKLRDRLNLLNIDDATEVFSRTVDELGKKFPILTNAFKDLDLSSADGIAKAREIIGVLLQASETGTDYWSALGLTFEEFFAALLELDSQIDGFAGNLDDAAETVITAGERMSAAMSDLMLQFEIFDIDDPAEQLKRFIAAIAEFAPGLAEGLTGIDLAGEAGRKQAKEFIKNIFEQIMSGDFDLGELSRDDVLRLLADANRILESIPTDLAEELADPSKAASRTAGSLAAFGATERTTVRAVDAILSGNVHLREIRDILLSGMRPMPIMSAPNVTSSAFGAGPSITFRISLTVNLYGTATAADGAAAGNAAAGALVEQIDRQLGQRYGLAQLESGTQVVP